jgi:hypothetical protein
MPLLGLAGLLLATLLYRYDPAAYSQTLTAMMMHPWPSPFIDAAQIPAVVDCARQGVDVFVSAPCDPLQRPLAYSPIWLWAGFLPADPSWLNWIGLGMDGAFFASLALLPAPRRWIGILPLALATFSSMPAFALERGNMDVVMFLLIITGGWYCFRRFPVRIVGYPFIVLAGFLKFYPFVLLLLFLRERMALFITLCLTVLALMAAFVWHFQAQLAEMANNLPFVSYYIDGFGFQQLPFGLEAVLQRLVAGLNDPSAGAPFQPHRSIPLDLGIFCLLVIATFTIAFWLANRKSFKSALETLAPDESGFLLIGAALICGCFFAGQNVSYRGIHFLFAFPGIIALALASAASTLRTLFRVTAVAILFVMWGLTLQQLVAWLSGGSYDPMRGSTAIYVYWIVRELAWWWIVSVFMGVLICFVAQSWVWLTLMAALRRRA